MPLAAEPCRREGSRRGEYLREFNGILGAADGMVEAEVTAIGRGAFEDANVGVDEELDVNRYEHTVLVHLRCTF